jgi:hypothetical protein
MDELCCFLGITRALTYEEYLNLSTFADVAVRSIDRK